MNHCEVKKPLERIEIAVAVQQRVLLTEAIGRDEAVNRLPHGVTTAAESTQTVVSTMTNLVPYFVTRPRRDSSRLPSQGTFPRSRRMLRWPRVRMSSRRPSSTAARLVRAPQLRMACRINVSSISMLVRTGDV